MDIVFDKYYTKPAVAKECIRIMLKHTTDCSMYVEPSAGNGSFIFDKTTFAFDIQPEDNRIIQRDWLTLDISYLDNWVCYGNPPYGKRNKLSQEFIRKAISSPSCQCIAFVLPTSYNKHTLQKVFPSNWDIVESVDLQVNSFLANGHEYSIPCVFQVWKKDVNTGLRTYPRTNLSNRWFEIVSSKEEADFYVMGAAPKTTKLKDEVNKNNRGYWIKSFVDVDVLREMFYECKWSFNSTASGGVGWLTKTELLNCFEGFYDDKE